VLGPDKKKYIKPVENGHEELMSFFMVDGEGSERMKGKRAAKARPMPSQVNLGSFIPKNSWKVLEGAQSLINKSAAIAGGHTSPNAPNFRLRSIPFHAARMAGPLNSTTSTQNLDYARSARVLS